MPDELEVAVYEPAKEEATKVRLALVQHSPKRINVAILDASGAAEWFVGCFVLGEGFKPIGGLPSTAPFPIDTEGRIKVS